MFVITGITGKVGGDVARSLLSKGQKVRAVVRDRAKETNGPLSVARFLLQALMTQRR